MKRSTFFLITTLIGLVEPAQAQEQAALNPYGLDALWAQGDLIARATLLVLLIMSALSWYILLLKLWEQTRLLRHGRHAQTRFWNAPTIGAGLSSLPVHSPFYHIATKGIAAAERHDHSLRERIDLQNWIGLSLQNAVTAIQNEQQSGLSVLATIGSTAPFVGLFGTVWGIYHALTAIGISGQASIDKVAGPVGESLIMTAIGLAVAVPAVLGYNALARRNKVALDHVRAFTAELHCVLLTTPPDQLR